ncbi:MAG: NAD(P)-binding domain-containing protein, partial [Acidobacteria bacterium]|nr:NAD(P)-binding domain-containing protein [Acidobacteriota bacterium]
MAHGIAILGGTGAEGSGLAMRFARAGARVVIGSRDLEKARAAAQRTGAAEGMLNADAAAGA